MTEDRESEARRKAAVEAWLYEHEPQSESKGNLGVARRLADTLAGPLWLLGGILLAITSLFVIVYVADYHVYMTSMEVAIYLVSLLPLWLGSWACLSRASVQLESSVELAP